MDEEGFESAETDAIGCSNEDCYWIGDPGEQRSIVLVYDFEGNHVGLVRWFLK